MPSNRKAYAIKTDTQYLYFLTNPEVPGSQQRTGVHADGEPMTRLDHKRTYTGAWYATDHEARDITATFAMHPEITGYLLTDQSVLSERYPRTLTREEFGDHVDEDVYRFYTATTLERPDHVHHYEGPYTVIDGSLPPVEDDLPWTADLPHELAERPEYLPYFPGYIPGLEADVIQRARAMRHVEHCYPERDAAAGTLAVTIRVPWKESVTVWSPNKGRSGKPLKSGRHVEQMVTQRFLIPVAVRVHGANYQEAAALYREHLDNAVDTIRSMNVRACNACDAHGYTTTTGETPSSLVEETFPGELEMLRALNSTLRVLAEHGSMDDVRKSVEEYTRDEADAHAQR